MKAILTVEMDNAAFEDEWAIELARILRELACRIENGAYNPPAIDYNGNKVGELKVTK